MTKKIICFDLYNTLITSTKTNGSAYEDVLVRFGIPRENIFPFVRDCLMTKDLNLDEIITVLFKEFGVSIKDNPEAFEEAKDSWNGDNTCRWIDGALDFLNELKRIPGIKTGLITNVTRVGWEDVEKGLSISDKFDELFLSWSEGVVKPDARCWLTMLDRLKNASVLPENCWMVGDRDCDDLSTPRNLGWNTFLVSPDGSMISQMREVILSSIE